MKCFLEGDPPSAGRYLLVFVLIRSDGETWNAGGEISPEEWANAATPDVWESRHLPAVLNLQAAERED